MSRDLRRRGIDALRRSLRLEIGGELDPAREPTLFVANHGFGSLFDLNVLATLAAFEEYDVQRPVTALVHQMAWTLGLGPLLERLGCRAASADAAREAFAAGHHVLVFPGGDLDAFKSRRDKDLIIFGGRSGFARLAMECDVPIVPVVTSGAGDTLFVLSDGQVLARALRLDRMLRLKALPVSLAFPWGLNVGLAGFLPYLPWRARLRTRVLPEMIPLPDETSDGFARRIEEAMQEALDLLAERREP